MKSEFEVKEKVLCYEPDENKARVLYDATIVEIADKSSGREYVYCYSYWLSFNSFKLDYAGSWDRSKVAIINLWLLILKHGQCEIGKGWFQAWAFSHGSSPTRLIEILTDPAQRKHLKMTKEKNKRNKSESFTFQVHGALSVMVKGIRQMGD